MKTKQRLLKDLLYMFNEHIQKEDVVNYMMEVLYENNGSHGIDHIKNVLNLGSDILVRFKTDPKYSNKYYSNIYDDFILTALFHDCTSSIDRDNHENSGADYFESIAEGILDPDRVILISNAIRHHRASYKGELNNFLEEVMSSADRGVPNSLELRITRSYTFNIERGLDIESSWNNAIKHMIEKFGRNGYQKLPDLYKEVFNRELSNLWGLIDKIHSLDLTSLKDSLLKNTKNLEERKYEMF